MYIVNRHALPCPTPPYPIFQAVPAVVVYFVHVYATSAIFFFFFLLLVHKNTVKAVCYTTFWSYRTDNFRVSVRSYEINGLLPALPPAIEVLSGVLL